MTKGKNKTYKDIDSSILEYLPNIGLGGYENRIDVPEFTFLGAHGQPDFGHITIWFYADKRIIELKSLKLYVVHYRDILVSYERAINCIYADLMKAYEPTRLRLEIGFRPRGGISSYLVIDSDWKCRGGTDTLWQSHGTSHTPVSKI